VTCDTLASKTFKNLSKSVSKSQKKMKEVHVQHHKPARGLLCVPSCVPVFFDMWPPPLGVAMTPRPPPPVIENHCNLGPYRASVCCPPRQIETKLQSNFTKIGHGEPRPQRGRGVMFRHRRGGCVAHVKKCHMSKK